jgi:ATP-dependent RNA helicase DeaD
MAPRSAQPASPSALVIVPTRELATQIREELEWLFAELPALQIEAVTGGTSLGLERRALSRGPSLVVATPGRLLDHLRNGAIDPSCVGQVVLDEADRMLDMGFREELQEILDQLPKERSTHLVSATFSGGVLQLANRYQDQVLALEGTRLGAANVDIEHVAHTIRRHESYAALVNILLLGGDSRCLVFVNRRVDAMGLADKLSADGFDAAPLSGELPQSQRQRTLDAFRTGSTKILVATDVAARGIDVPEIATVIHADPPRNPDDYTHRSGRTGRGGKTGRSVLLVLGPEARRVERMLRSSRVEVSWQPVPSPDLVRKALKKAGRRELHERFAASPPPTEAQLAYAKTLLEDREPEALVAMLLEIAIPKPKIEPVEVQGLDPFSDRSGGRANARPRLGARNAPSASGRPVRPTRYTQFQVNWGDKGGATAKRLLSHVCRRGDLASHQVGAIRITAKSATIDIASDVAGDFESKTRRPDNRDPEVVIRRAEGGDGSGQRNGPSSGPAKGPGNGRPDRPKAGLRFGPKGAKPPGGRKGRGPRS